MPASRSTTWPRMHSCPVISPATALPTTASCTSDASRLASFERVVDGFPGEALQAPVVELPELRHAEPGYDDPLVGCHVATSSQGADGPLDPAETYGMLATLARVRAGCQGRGRLPRDPRLDMPAPSRAFSRR